MPVIINEVITEVTPAVTPAPTRQPAEAIMPAAAAEYELLQTLNVISERQARLQID